MELGLDWFTGSNGCGFKSSQKDIILECLFYQEKQHVDPNVVRDWSAGADLGFQKGGLFFLPNSGCGFSNSKGYNIYIYLLIFLIIINF